MLSVNDVLIKMDINEMGFNLYVAVSRDATNEMGVSEFHEAKGGFIKPSDLQIAINEALEDLNKFISRHG